MINRKATKDLDFLKVGLPLEVMMAGLNQVVDLKKEVVMMDGLNLVVVDLKKEEEQVMQVRIMLLKKVEIVMQIKALEKENDLSLILLKKDTIITT